MKPTRPDIERLVRQQTWPAPSAELRARVLDTAPAATPSIPWSDRIWFSWRWRVGLAAVVAVLISLNLLSTLQMEDVADGSASPASRAQVLALLDGMNHGD